MERRQFLAAATALIPVSFSVPNSSREVRLEQPETEPESDWPQTTEQHQLFIEHLARQEKAKRALKELADFTETKANKCRKAVCKRWLPETRDYRDAFIDQFTVLHKSGWYDLCNRFTHAAIIWCAIELTFRSDMDGFSFFSINLEEEIQKKKELIDWFAENDPSILSYARLRNRYSSQETKLGVINEMQTSPMD